MKPHWDVEAFPLATPLLLQCHSPPSPPSPFSRNATPLAFQRFNATTLPLPTTWFSLNIRAPSCLNTSASCKPFQRRQWLQSLTRLFARYVIFHSVSAGFLNIRSSSYPSDRLHHNLSARSVNTRTSAPARLAQRHKLVMTSESVRRRPPNF